jgi:hypothetical protein
MSQGYTLLVNSCDGFEDCWSPFFKLLTRYWLGPLPRVLLNTETTNWRYPGIDMEATQVQLGREGRLTWGECLGLALDRVDTPLVLYMQEDYFIESAVDVQLIDQLVRKMLEDPTIQHIGLTHFGCGHPMHATDDPLLWEIGPRARYRLSTQAGLWRTQTLRSYVLPWENGWMFELFGTFRSWKRRERFLTLARDQGHPAVTYQHTGIIKGQWARFVPALFKREGLDVDFQRRGMYDHDASALLRRFRLAREVCRRPWLSLKSLYEH